MNGFERRLDRLEALWVPDDDQTVEQDDQEERSQALYGELLATMAPEHVQRICDYLRRDEAGEGTSDKGAARLLEVVSELVRARLNGRDNFKLALPEQVADVYLTDPTAHPFEQCTACLLTLPLGRVEVPWSGGGRELRSRSCFMTCPECGGGVASWDKWHGGPPMPTPEQKRAGR